MKLALSLAGAGLLWPAAACASDWERLAKDGYGVALSTSVTGEFKGCEFGKRIALDNGMVFVCAEYNYSYEYSPEVYILKNVRTGSIAVVIGDNKYDGTLFQR